MDQRVLVCWDGYSRCPGGKMILCGDKTADYGDREGAVVGFSPRCTLGGGRKWQGGTKKHSYVKIRYGA